MSSNIVYLVSENPKWSHTILASLTLTFDESTTFIIKSSVCELWNLSRHTLVIYDRKTLGNPSSQLIVPIARGGAWIIVNATSSDIDGVQGLIALGFFGLIESKYTPESLHKALRHIMSGQLWFSREAMSSSLIHILNNNSTHSISLDVLGSKYGLSSKEQRVFMFLIQGRTNKEITTELNISLSTVKTHVSNILTKTGKHSRGQLNTLLIESNI